MNYIIDVQHACEERVSVTDDMLTHWAIETLSKECTSAELTLR
jgi:hypothetical protein